MASGRQPPDLVDAILKLQGCQLAPPDQQLVNFRANFGIVRRSSFGPSGFAPELQPQLRWLGWRLR
jgi:hypothetical protein